MARLSKVELMVVVIGLGGVVALGLYPPWEVECRVHYVRQGADRYVVYAWVFEPPRGVLRDEWGVCRTSLEAAVLVELYATWGVLCVGLVVLSVLARRVVGDVRMGGSC